MQDLLAPLAVPADGDLGPGLILFRGHLDEAAQRALLAEIREIVREAPWFVPRMPRTGRAFSVRMTNCGPLGWVSDQERGYRYQAMHPETGKPWPPLPASLLGIWRDVSGYPHPPEACLVNFYGQGARMGPHQDRDEAALDAPVVSISLGDRCCFRYGGLRRLDPSAKLPLCSGDVLVMGGPSRLIFHGVDRIDPGSSPLLSGGGRINLTLRRVTRP